MADPSYVTKVEPVETITLAADSFYKLLDERNHLRRQVGELQEELTRRVNERRSTLRAQVREFHAMLSLPILDRPQVPPDDRVRLRMKLIAEEFYETLGAVFPEARLLVERLWSNTKDLIASKRVEVDMVQLVDGLADIDYVVEGTRCEFGVDGAPVAAEVQRSNLAKYPTTIREDGKVLKPPTWTPPDIAGVLRAQGWKEKRDENRKEEQLEDGPDATTA